MSRFQVVSIDRAGFAMSSHYTSSCRQHCIDVYCWCIALLMCIVHSFKVQVERMISRLNAHVVAAAAASSQQHYMLNCTVELLRAAPISPATGSNCKKLQS